MNNLKHIVLFEHETLSFDPNIEHERELYKALVAYHGNYTPFFKLIRNGVKFSQYVGVLQVGDSVIEVLPKADKSSDKSMWQNLLINMIISVWGFTIKESGMASLKLKHNSVLDLYFELFVSELEGLQRRGLIKKILGESKNKQNG